MCVCESFVDPPESPDGHQPNTARLLHKCLRRAFVHGGSVTFSLANLSRCAAGGPEHEIGRTSLNWQHLLYKIDALIGFRELL